MQHEARKNDKRMWLFSARKAKNLTAKEVAEAIGISRSHYSMIENNMAMPSFSVALQIASILEVDPTNFISKDMLLNEAPNRKKA